MVFLQDLKERKIYWFWLPIIAFCSGFMLYNAVTISLFYSTLLVNLGFILLLFVVVFFYSKLKLKLSIKDTFGLGDGLLFLALIFTFPSVSFLILFIFSLIFSLVVHIILKQNSKHKTVPLAGYISLFFSVVYISHWLGLLSLIYSI